MAVPKKKTSKSKKGLRRGGNHAFKITLSNVMVDKDTGEYKLAHHISSDGYYNGKKVITTKKDKKDAKQSAEETTEEKSEE